MRTLPPSSASALTQVSYDALPRAMLTAVTSSLIDPPHRRYKRPRATAADRSCLSMPRVGSVDRQELGGVMHARRLIYAGLALACACAALAPTAAAKQVRMFAVGYKQRLADVVTYETYRDKMFALVDANVPNRAALVQAGVDDVASHIQPADPGAPPLVLVNFPEDVSLIAGLIGSRGAVSRAQTSSAVAIVLLATPYAPIVQYYTGKFGVGFFTSDLFVAVTDTFYRSVYETFRDVAMTYGVYVTLSADVAPARRVEDTEDPALVALLRDPDEPARSYAYEAVSHEVRNVVFIFAPDGEILVPQPDGSTLRSPSQTGGVILPSIGKAYLVPLELDLLGLRPTAVRDMDVVDTPVGRIGVVISKDAWMTDVNDRFEAKNAQVLVQSEAFSDWAFGTAEWAPDVYKEGGFSFLQRNPSFVVTVAPSLTGNLFDITFDGQSTIIGKKTKTAPGPLSPTNAWIGQNPDTGFLALGPWVIDDPGIANPALTLAERRTELVDGVGTALLPGSGVLCPGDLVAGACENGYREAVVRADVELPDGPTVLAPVDPGPRVPTAFGTNVRVNPADGPTPSAQKNARIAASRHAVAVVWQDERHALPATYLAISRDGGATFGAPAQVSDHPAGTVAELHPDVAIAGRHVRIVWQELASGRDDDRGRIMLARFDLHGRKRGGDVRVDDVDDSGKWRPAVAVDGRRTYVAWVDERDQGPGGIPLEHIYFARSGNGGRSFEPSRRLDSGAPVALATRLDNKWAPAIAAARRSVVVGWADFRNYNWDVFAVASADRGETFAANERVDDFAPAVERLHQNPAVALAANGERTIVAWTDVRAREADSNIFFATRDGGGGAFSANAQLDGSKAGFAANADTPSNQWAVQLAAFRDDVCAVWQDNRLGNNDVFFAASRDGGLTFGPDERVDDTGAGISNQYNPDVAAARVRGQVTCFVVWEDTRDGDSDVYVARRSLGSGS